ncbi:GxxExxY protein [Tamlana crocina]
MEIHNQLGKGFNEVVYADALEIEFIDNNINYSREKKFDINYKGNLLPHKYIADFTVNDKIVFGIKSY